MKVAVVTGAGSGVGQATALLLARLGWRVALVGRREAALRETIGQAGADGEAMLPIACDIGDERAVQRMAEQVHAEWGGAEVLVNAAGVNTPERSLRTLSREDYQRIVDTNMNGAYYCVRAFLPGMRERRSGTIVNIVSIAALRPSALAGAAYTMSKFGMAGLTHAINAEERANGIRACGIYPGDINTPLLDQRPSPPAAEARQRMIQPEDAAQCVLTAITLPPRAVIEELVLMPG